MKCHRASPRMNRSEATCEGREENMGCMQSARKPSKGLRMQSHGHQTRPFAARETNHRRPKSPSVQLRAPLTYEDSIFVLPNVRGQPRDERLSKTENGPAIALCCDVWFGALRLANFMIQIEAVRRQLIKPAIETTLDNRSSLLRRKYSGRLALEYPTPFRAPRSSRNSRTPRASFF